MSVKRSSSSSQRTPKQAISFPDPAVPKVRFAGRGKGKSGGYRVITYFGGGDIPVFLLNVFSKGDRVNLSKAEVNALRDELAGLADEYRKRAKQNVKGRN
jgi:hypothetical protein